MMSSHSPLQIWPPSPSITYYILWGILLIKAWMCTLSRPSHSYSTFVQKSLKLENLHLSSYCYTIPHAFSIGLRSGLLPGHYKHCIPSAFKRGSTSEPVCGLALSYWKINVCLNSVLENNYLTAGSNFYLSIIRYSGYDTPLYF